MLIDLKISSIGFTLHDHNCVCPRGGATAQTSADANHYALHVEDEPT